MWFAECVRWSIDRCASFIDRVAHSLACGRTFIGRSTSPAECGTRVIFWCRSFIVCVASRTGVQQVVRGVVQVVHRPEWVVAGLCRVEQCVCQFVSRVVQVLHGVRHVPARARQCARGASGVGHFLVWVVHRVVKGARQVRNAAREREGPSLCRHGREKTHQVVGEFFVNARRRCRMTVA